MKTPQNIGEAPCQSRWLGCVTLPTTASQQGCPAQFPSPELHGRKSWRGFSGLLCQNLRLQPCLAGTVLLLPILQLNLPNALAQWQPNLKYHRGDFERSKSHLSLGQKDERKWDFPKIFPKIWGVFWKECQKFNTRAWTHALSKYFHMRGLLRHKPNSYSATETNADLKMGNSSSLFSFL